ncbi:ATP-binding cassette domain-containing protein [Actinospica durhamensis]|uniref:ATP-binding cassette domain-containing protein n=1 Tax=Actinospica durhamensis TaxID=1508375 RepID=A0A941EQR4_9ACTN|nr:ATP-binding cassette domain-containing protein [Actinospica durhamensis]MBR7833394.1 ATP-binding cassette domain-containing protein [Actinospica durhamensis]
MNPAAPSPAITASGLRKSFGEKVVLDGVDLSVAEGTVFCLLGPNGAGKTTAVQILSTLLPADGGQVRVAGHDLVREPDAVRAAIGVTGQFSAVDGLLTGRENLLLMASLHHLRGAEGRRRAQDLLRRFDLVEAADKRASTYSGGMRRRLDLAMTLVGEPRLIFLDEPTTGLDPRSRRTMWQIVRELVRSGVTIFLTTQYLDEADELADQIAVLDQGRIVATGTSAELKRRVPGGHIRLQFTEEAPLAAAEQLLEEASRGEGLALNVPGETNVRALRALLTRLEQASIEVEGLALHTPDLDDVFFALTGHAAAESPATEDDGASTNEPASASADKPATTAASARDAASSHVPPQQPSTPNASAPKEPTR